MRPRNLLILACLLFLASSGAAATHAEKVSENGSTYLLYDQNHVLADPIYRLSFSADKSSVPDLYYKSLTYVVHVGTVSNSVVTAEGAVIPSFYLPATGDLWFTSEKGDFQVLVGNPAATGVFSVSKAALRDNRSFAWSHGFDDNVYLRAGVSLFNAKGWRGTLFLIGSEISDTRNEDWIFDKPALTILLDQGWALGNHTETHTCDGDQTKDPTFIRNTILNGYNRLMDIVNSSDVPNYKLLAFAAPCFSSYYDPYISEIRSEGTTAVMFNESQGNALMQVDQGAAGYTASGKTAAPVSSDTIKIGRDASIEWDNQSVIATIDWMAGNASSSRHFWYITLAHGGKEGAVGPVIDHAYGAYGPPGTDQIWVAPSTEIYSYMLVRDRTVLSPLEISQFIDSASGSCCSDR